MRRTKQTFATPIFVLDWAGLISLKLKWAWAKMATRRMILRYYDTHVCLHNLSSGYKQVIENAYQPLIHDRYCKCTRMITLCDVDELTYKILIAICPKEPWVAVTRGLVHTKVDKAMKFWIHFPQFNIHSPCNIGQLRVHASKHVAKIRNFDPALWRKEHNVVCK